MTSHPSADLSVLQVVASTDRRGAEVFAQQLHGALADRFRMHTLALAPGDTVGLPMETLGRRRLGMRTLAALRTRMRSADIVVAHGSSTLPASVIGGFGLRTPVVYRNIGDPLQWSSDPLRRLRTRALLGRTQAVVALAPRTQDVLAEAFGVPRGRLRVIPNGADGAVFTRITSDERSRARAHLGVAEDARLALYLGALSAEKNVGVAIDAIGGLDDVCLVIAGDGPERERLAETAQRCAPARVIFVGRVDDPRTCYSAADVVVLPSRTEGMPAVLIEAGLCALPVVATDVGFVREIVVPGRTGVLVDVGDVESFRRAIERAVLDRDRLGREADRHCRARFTLARVANDWAELICEIAG